MPKYSAILLARPHAETQEFSSAFQNVEFFAPNLIQARSWAPHHAKQGDWYRYERSSLERIRVEDKDLKPDSVGAMNCECCDIEPDDDPFPLEAYEILEALKYVGERLFADAMYREITNLAETETSSEEGGMSEEEQEAWKGLRSQYYGPQTETLFTTQCLLQDFGLNKEECLRPAIARAKDTADTLNSLWKGRLSFLELYRYSPPDACREAFSDGISAWDDLEEFMKEKLGGPKDYHFHPEPPDVSYAIAEVLKQIMEEEEDS